MIPPWPHLATMGLYRAEERAGIAQLLIDLVLTIYRGGRMKSPPCRNLGGEIELILVASVVLTAHVSGKLKTTSEIGRALGIPRVTVRRKLQELVDRDLVERVGTRYCIIDPTDKTELNYIDRAQEVVLRAKIKRPN